MKGSAFTARFAYLRERYGSRWEQLVATFDPETQVLARGPCLKGSWYDFACFVDLNVKAERMFGDGRMTLVRELGKNAAMVNLPGLYKLFYKVGSPDFILGKAATIWRQHHDTGHAEGGTTSPNSAYYRVYEFAAPHVTLCRSLEGFLYGSLEAMRMSDVKITEPQCRLRGDECCGFVCNYGTR
jgi:hypothetical protein